MQHKNQTNNKKKMSQRTRSNGSNMHGPPQFSSNIRLKHRYRFVCTSSAFTGAITAQKVAQVTGAICTVTNTTVALINYSVRIKSIELWTPPASQGASATCSVEWVGSANSPNVEISDTTISVASPAHVLSRPPPSSIASFWQLNGSGASLFNLVCPVGTIIDLVLELIQNDQNASTTVAVTTGVLSTIYYLALDHGTSDKLVPISLSTTT